MEMGGVFFKNLELYPPPPPYNQVRESSGNTKKAWHLLSRDSQPGLLHVKAVIKNSAIFAEKLFGELFLSRKRAPSHVCSYEFCEIFQNSYSIELL